MIPMQMELGGKDACIVLDDADLDLAATNIVKGGFSYRFVHIASDLSFSCLVLRSASASAAMFV